MSSAEEMRELFARWEGSGLNLRAFGEREGIAYSKLLYWRRRLRSGSEEKQGAVRTSPSEGWTPVRVIADVIPEKQEARLVEVRLANGVLLGVPLGLEEDELRRLVGILSTC
jgi:hypothetical protein